MKKTSVTLRLQRQTLKVLYPAALARVQGGTEDFANSDACGTKACPSLTRYGCPAKLEDDALD